MARIVQPGAIHSGFRSIFPRRRPAYPNENLAKGRELLLLNLPIIAQFVIAVATNLKFWSAYSPAF